MEKKKNMLLRCFEAKVLLAVLFLGHTHLSHLVLRLVLHDGRYLRPVYRDVLFDLWQWSDCGVLKPHL